MDDRPIQVGDLVQVIKPSLCCNNITYLGDIFVVSAMEKKSSRRCLNCGKKYEPTIVVEGHQSGIGAFLYRLKRIPPLSELESDKIKESEPIPC